MITIGVDYHPSFQMIAFLMEETGGQKTCGSAVLDVAKPLAIFAVG